MKSHHTRLPLVLSLLAAGIVGCEGSGSSDTAGWMSSPDEPRAFVTTLGNDTTTVELYTKTADHIEGILVERVPVTQVTHYSADRGPDGRIVRLSADWSTSASNSGIPAPFSWTAEIADGKATVERTGGNNPGTTEMEISGYAIPTLGRWRSAMYVFEQVADHLSGPDASEPVLLIGPTSPRPAANNVRKVSADTVSMDYFGSPRVGWIGDAGQVMGASGAATTDKSETRRVRSVDPDAKAKYWASLDAKGEGMGALSIPGTVSATVDGATFEIVYTRPAKRGRQIWHGGLVPYDEVWRTGANAATLFTTGRDIMIGDVRIPAGAYTLWSLFRRDGQELIINKQTGQWGTAYDASQDLARVPLQETALSEPLERFTLSIDDTDAGGRINLDWDQTRYFVNFTVR